MSKNVIIAIAVSFGFTAFAGNTASTNALAKAQVKKSIAIAKTQDLDFGMGFTGDSAVTVSASDSSAAKFSVSGEKNKAYNIVLPSSVTISTGDGVGPDKQIEVTGFSSSPNSSGNLGATGAQVVGVGGTRGALTSNQESGDYSGVFTVTVTYQ